MIKKIFTAVVLVVVVVGLALLVVAKLGEAREPAVSIERVHAQEGLPVEVTTPRVRSFRDFLMCNGDVVAHDRAVVRAKVSEVAQEVKARVGEQVSKGQLLVRFRTTDLQAELDAARQAYDEASSRLERYRGLLDQGVVSRERFDQIQTAYNQAESALRSMRSQMEFATLVSPIDGIVEERSVEPGEYVQRRDRLFTIVSLDVVDVKANVPERYRSSIERGMQGQFQLRARKIVNAWYTGTVTRMSPVSDDPNRFFDVFLRVETVRPESAGADEPDNHIEYGNILPGMYAEVRFVVDNVENAVGVPSSSVVYAGAERLVYVVRDETREIEEPIEQEKIDNSFPARLERGVKRLTGQAEEIVRTRTVTEEIQVARRIDVNPGLRDEDMVQLIGAELEPDTRVIVNPSQDIRDGSRVRIVEDAAEGEGE
jgi:membrane fusion protein (multidrug efflux system)